MVFTNTTVLIVGNKVGHTAIQRQSVIIRVFTSNRSSTISRITQDDLDNPELLMSMIVIIGTLALCLEIIHII